MWDTTRSAPDRASEPERAPEARLSAEPVLELQRTIGNRATGQVLAREAVEADTKRQAVIDVTDLGRIPLLSWSRGGTGGVGVAHSGKLQTTELVLSSATGKFSAKIMEAVTKGTHFDTAVLTGNGITITLKDVIVSNYSSGGGSGPDGAVDQWTLTFASIDYKYDTGG
ncbi:MAG: type secretion system secreted protein Hcp [Thermoleophilaceae bacterium]|jgi:hypothetical protein|nr:type secretion system secreted protein Hcp [Thermoleophilaceae bacterium]